MSVFRMPWLHLLLVVGMCCASMPMLADGRPEIDSKADEALATLRGKGEDVVKLLDAAAGVVIFPDVVKMGFGVGGEYGEGVLRIGGESVAYYATAGASFGLQIGAQNKAEVIAFMDQQTLIDFRNSRGWEAGVDASIALAKVGAGGGLDLTHMGEPVVAFIFSNKGLMYNLTLEGSKITRIAR